MAADDEEVPLSATVYVRNLDENIKIPALIDSLHELFDSFGEIIEIVAKKNIKARGQAFIVYDSEEAAQDAIDTLQDFEVGDKPLKLAFAKTRSDATVKREDGEEGFEQHKKHRLAEKERKKALEAANQKQTKRPATDALAERPAKTTKPAPSAAGAVPDEYLPPNKILFLRELPDDYGTVELTAIFNRYPGFREVRTVPGRKGIAFVEYESDDGAIAAKESTTGMVLGEKAIRVTFQRQ